MTNIDLCGIAQLLRTLIEQKKTTERPANKSQVEISAFGSSEKGKTKSSR